MPTSILRTMGKSPSSSSSSVKMATAGDSHWYRCFRRVTSRVPPPGSGASLHDQVLSGLDHSSHSPVSNAATLNAVASVTLLAIGIQSPTRGCWYCSRTSSALS